MIRYTFRILPVPDYKDSFKDFRGVTIQVGTRLLQTQLFSYKIYL